MSDADRAVLRTILTQDKSQRYPDMPADKHFEIFSTEQVMKGYGLDSEDIEAGIVGGSNDGGVDSAYFLIDRKLIREDPVLETFQGRRDIPFALVLIQSTRETGFQEVRVDKLRIMTDDLLNIGQQIGEDANPRYDTKLLEILRRFQSTYLALLNRHPILNISYHYVAQADATNPNVEKKAIQLKERVNQIYAGAICRFEFITARGLLDKYHSNPPITMTLRFYKSLSSSEFGNAYVCLVPLPEFYKFITMDGELRQDIFESNVRDYQGEVRVNKAIEETLVNDKTEEFWWLNNGITVLASEVVSSGDYLSVYCAPKAGHKMPVP